MHNRKNIYIYSCIYETKNGTKLLKINLKEGGDYTLTFPAKVSKVFWNTLKHILCCSDNKECRVSFGIQSDFANGSILSRIRINPFVSEVTGTLIYLPRRLHFLQPQWVPLSLNNPCHYL